MKFPEYRKLTIKTMSDTGSKITDSTHMTLGLNTEVMGELPEAMTKEDLVNFKEEIGDAFWYLANYCNIWEIDPVNEIAVDPVTFGAVPLKKNNGQMFMLVFGIGQTIALLQDLDKKHLAYGKEGDHTKRIEMVNAIYTMLEYISHILGVDTDSAREVNIEKLTARYPDLRFDADKANNRDLDVERAILEGAVPTE